MNHAGFEPVRLAASYSIAACKLLKEILFQLAICARGFLSGQNAAAVQLLNLFSDLFLVVPDVGIEEGEIVPIHGTQVCRK